MSSKNTFWDRVRESYINDEDPSYDDVDCDENHPNAFDDIDPSNIVQHTATKLEKMWKEVNGRWKKIVAKFNTSGQHDYEFWNFCEGQLDVLYLNTRGFYLLVVVPKRQMILDAGLVIFKEDILSTSICQIE